MSMNYSVAFSVYKEGVKDDDGLAKVADVHVGLTSGPLGGLTVEGILIKQHKLTGLQVVLPKNVECFLKPEERADVEVAILKAFISSFESAMRPKAEPKLDDFTGVPEPKASKWAN